jgi:hypothetical protein
MDEITRKEEISPYSCPSHEIERFLVKDDSIETLLDHHGKWRNLFFV